MTDRQYTSLHALRQDPLWKHVVLDDITQVPDINHTYNLDSPIHPLWRWQAWRRVDILERNSVSLGHCNRPEFNYSQDAYSRLMPALQLATILLCRAAPLLIRLAVGPMHRHPDRRGGTPILDPMWTPSADDEANFDQWLIDLSSRYCIVAGPTSSGPDDRTGATMGFTDWFDDDYYGKINNNGILCAVAADVLGEILNDSWLSRPELAKATIYVSLAELLIHELAHAVYSRRLILQFTPLYLNTTRPAAIDQLHRDFEAAYGNEPSIWPEHYHELGFAAGAYLFGCDVSWPLQTQQSGATRTRSITPVVNGAWGMFAKVFDMHRNMDTMKCYPITMATVSSFFDKDTWDAHAVPLHLWPQVRSSTRIQTYSCRHDPALLGLFTSPLEAYWQYNLHLRQQ